MTEALDMFQPGLQVPMNFLRIASQTVFDLNLVEHPALQPTLQDVEVVFAPPPPPPPARQGLFFAANSNQVWLSLPGVVDFFIQEGQQIWVSPQAPGQEVFINCLFTETPLAMLLAQRGHLVLHGSAIANETGAALLLGLSGAGKSSLAAALYQRGFRFLCDEVCAIRVSTEAPPFVLPGPAHLLLWQDALRNLGVENQDLTPIRPGLNKYIFPIARNHATTPIEVKTIFVLSAGQTRQIEHSSLTGRAKLVQVLHQLYQPYIQASLGLEKRSLKYTSQLVAHADVFQIIRPETPSPLEQTADIIATYLKQ